MQKEHGVVEYVDANEIHYRYTKVQTKKEW
jgi:hypothetical protein